MTRISTSDDSSREAASLAARQGDSQAEPGVCVVSTYEGALHILGDSRIRRLLESRPEHDPMVADELPRFIGVASGKRPCQALRSELEDTAQNLIEDLRTQGRADLIDEFVSPIVYTALFTIVGIPVGQRDAIRQWCDSIPREPEVYSAPGPHWEALRAHLHGLLHSTHPEGSTSLCAQLAAAIASGELTFDQAIRGAGITLIQGYPATTRLISDLLLALLIDPDKRGYLQQHPDRVPAAVEEMLRYSTPDFHAALRRTPIPVTVGEVSIPEGAVIDVQLGAANRDPAQFSQPNLVDFSRTDKHHLAFGHGHRYCPGATLARLEATIAATSLLPHLHDLQLAIEPHEIRWSRNRKAMIAIIDALPIIWTADR
ncbi:cytochrome P450 [Rhizocola hellebori]|uniref:Cytochrome P450 n=1 Tax=Rhizocola hellebori TaxID=1392758 RepID=A0A8J3Q5Z2_9ACTN|nr:cytochrome P450 [Rhizocola hellebori]GIH03936.1 cytochrome P450 [Rhizocola hellebori]